MTLYQRSCFVSCSGRSFEVGGRCLHGLGDLDCLAWLCLSPSLSLSSWTFISSSESEWDSYPRANCIDCAANSAAAAEWGTSDLKALFSNAGCGLKALPSNVVCWDSAFNALLSNCAWCVKAFRAFVSWCERALKALFSPPICGVW